MRFAGEYPSWVLMVSEVGAGVDVIGVVPVLVCVTIDHRADKAEYRFM